MPAIPTRAAAESPPISATTASRPGMPVPRHILSRGLPPYVRPGFPGTGARAVRKLRRAILPALLLIASACAPDSPAPTDPLGPDLTDPQPDTTARGPGSWSFTGPTPAPLPFDEPGWDVQIHSRDRDTWIAPQPVEAHHGMDCGPHPATHRVTGYEEMVFRCRDHLMTSIRADGYGVIVLTPDRMLDWSAGEAVLRFDVSTFRSSVRDWIKIWISPFETQLPVPAGEFVPDLNGAPSDAVFLEMTSRGNLCPRLVRDFEVTSLPCTDGQDLSEHVLPSATARVTVEVRLSSTHLKVSLPEAGLVFSDTPLPGRLPFSQGVVQFAHYSYTPEKCDGCSGANTWHWDEIRMAPSLPFAISRGDRRYVNGNGGEVAFPRPAPAGARLRFVAAGVAPEVSFDGGATWAPAREQASSRTSDPVRQYWMPVPAGTRQVHLRPGSPITWWPHADLWIARDFAIWSR